MTISNTNSLVSSITSANVGLASWADAGYSETEWIAVRKHTYPEPTFGSSLIEELDITAVEPFTLSSNTCIGPCLISAGVTWHNYGNNSVTFRPAVLIDGTTFAYATTDLTIPSGQDGYAIIVTPTLSLGSHNICPYPN